MTPFDVLDQISASYYGKQLFFLQDNGTVYNRYTGLYTTLEQAVEWFASYLCEDD